MRACAVVVRLAAPIGAFCTLVSAPLALPDVYAPEPNLSMSALWQQPTDLAARDLFVGEWGAERAPDPFAVYTFVRKKAHGASPGATVSDPGGRRWHVKQGREAQPEVVLSRVLSAVGYHQPPEYFLKSFVLRDGGGSVMSVVADFVWSTPH